MALTHKLLATGQFAATTAAIYTAPASTVGMVKAILLHNTNATPEDVQIFFDGTADPTRILKVTIASDETFEWSIGHMLVVDGNSSQVLNGDAQTASKVNYFIFGAEE